MKQRKTYFHRVHDLTQTRFWINNPTSEEARLAIEAGAMGCTLNPSYTYKMYRSDGGADALNAEIDELVKKNLSRDEVAVELQRKVAKPIQEIFLPMWKQSGGVHGYVSIQGDPVHEHDAQTIIDEARDNCALGPNIAAKIPLTRAGLEAIEVLVAEDIPINATEIMSIAQGVELCEAYLRASQKSGKKPPLWLSFIAGIYDEYLLTHVQSENIDIELDLVRQAGMAATRKMYEILQERGYPAIIIGGGARQLYHFTEMVGANLVVTINWVGTADALIAEDADVVSRFFNPVPHTVVDVLKDKLVDFQRGYDANGLTIDEFETFGPVELFRSMFLKSWNAMLTIIDDRKAN